MTFPAVAYDVRMALLTCSHCGKRFERTKWAHAKHPYCSDECRRRGRAARGFTMLDGVCETCREPFQYRSNGSPPHRFCSNACGAIARMRRVTVTCAFCGKDLERLRGEVKSLNFCGLECHSAWMSTNTGDKNPNWNGRRRLESKGYTQLRVSGLTGAARETAEMMRGGGRNPYVLEHRLVMAMHLGRPLGRFEVVHHLNGVKTDNRIENLQLTKANNHMKKHAAAQAEMKALRAENTILKALLFALSAES